MPVTIHDPRTPPPRPIITLDFTPKSTIDVINIGGDTFPWAEDEPTVGAPAQPAAYSIDTEVPTTFTATVEPYGDDFITEYEWDFGDGTKGYGQEVIHTYRVVTPQLRVSLCVRDNRFRRFCIGRQIRVNPANFISVGIPAPAEPI